MHGRKHQEIVGIVHSERKVTPVFGQDGEVVRARHAVDNVGIVPQLGIAKATPLHLEHTWLRFQGSKDKSSSIGNLIVTGLLAHFVNISARISLGISRMGDIMAFSLAILVNLPARADWRQDISLSRISISLCISAICERMRYLSASESAAFEL